MIKLAIIGTGGMAHAHARSFQDIPGVTLVAACDVDRKRVKAFAKAFNIPQTYTAVEDLLTQSDCEAVANVTPDIFHAPISLKVIESGRHILCEKPLATHYEDAQAMAKAAKKRGIIHMVNFTYRNSSALQMAAQMVAEGQLGDIRHVDAQYLQSWLTSLAWGDWKTSPSWLWRLSTSHGSKGVLGDIGVHILDFASFPVGKIKSVHCKLKNFKKARGNRIGDYALDANDSAVMTVEFANGAMGTIHCTRYATGHINSVALSLHGTEGALRIDLDHSYSEMEVCLGEDRHTATWKRITCPPTPNVYARFVHAIETGINDQPDFHQGAAIQKALDACFQSNTEDRTLKI